MGSVAERDDKSKDTGRSGGKDGRAQAVQTLAERAEAADFTANKADFRAKKFAARRCYLVTETDQQEQATALQELNPPLQQRPRG